MCELVGGVDNECIKGVVMVKVGYVSGSGIGIVWVFGEVIWLIVLVIVLCCSVVINFVVVGCGVW